MLVLEDREASGVFGPVVSCQSCPCRVSLLVPAFLCGSSAPGTRGTASTAALMRAVQGFE